MRRPESSGLAQDSGSPSAPPGMARPAVTVTVRARPVPIWSIDTCVPFLIFVSPRIMAVFEAPWI